MSIHSLARLGLSDSFRQSFSLLDEHHELVPGRVAAEHRGAFVVFTEHGEVVAGLGGSVRHRAASRKELPAVGDWVALSSSGVIRSVLPRESAFVRAVAGGVTEAQVVAANVDVVVVVCAVDDRGHLRRLDRFLAIVRSSGALPAIALTKCDLHPSPELEAEKVRRVANGAPVHLVSNATGLGVDEIRAYFVGASADRTIALVGASGAGKSSLVNCLLGPSTEQRMITGGLATDGRGAHTTTHRQLLLVPTGGLVIDTPGMRELRLWDASAGLDATFEDVTALTEGCRFRDCGHEGEPGCAVQAALESGALDPDRHQRWEKLRREDAAFERRHDARLAAEAKRRFKVFSRAARVREKGRD